MKNGIDNKIEMWYSGIVNKGGVKMYTYKVKKINLSKVNNLDEYWDAVNKAQIKYCKGLKEVREYCGGKLHRERCGYAGIIGNIEYVAIRCE